jgi:hypothetical protein
MNKDEAINKIINTLPVSEMGKAKEWLSNHVEAPFNDRRYTAKEVYKLLGEYAQQVSRGKDLKIEKLELRIENLLYRINLKLRR